MPPVLEQLGKINSAVISLSHSEKICLSLVVETDKNDMDMDDLRCRSALIDLIKKARAVRKLFEDFLADMNLSVETERTAPVFGRDALTWNVENTTAMSATSAAVKPVWQRRPLNDEKQKTLHEFLTLLDRNAY